MHDKFWQSLLNSVGAGFVTFSGYFPATGDHIVKDKEVNKTNGKERTATSRQKNKIIQERRNEKKQTVITLMHTMGKSI